MIRWLFILCLFIWILVGIAKADYGDHIPETIRPQLHIWVSAGIVVGCYQILENEIGCNLMGWGAGFIKEYLDSQKNKSFNMQDMGYNFQGLLAGNSLLYLFNVKYCREF